jgi:hypothetical protein
VVPGMNRLTPSPLTRAIVGIVVGRSSRSHSSRP